MCNTVTTGKRKRKLSPRSIMCKSAVSPFIPTADVAHSMIVKSNVPLIVTYCVNYKQKKIFLKIACFRNN